MPELIAGQIAWVGCWAHYTDPHMGSKQCHHNHYRNWQLELLTGLREILQCLEAAACGKCL